MPPSPAVIDFLVQQRSALDQLELFAGTSEYERLLAALRAMVDGDLESWLAGWLVDPSEALACRPIDLVKRPDGLPILVAELENMSTGAYS